MQLNSPHLLDKYGKILVRRNGAFFYFSAIRNVPLDMSVFTVQVGSVQEAFRKISKIKFIFRK